MARAVDVATPSRRSAVRDWARGSGRWSRLVTPHAASGVPPGPRSIAGRCCWTGSPGRAARAGAARRPRLRSSRRSRKPPAPVSQRRVGHKTGADGASAPPPASLGWGGSSRWSHRATVVRGYTTTIDPLARRAGGSRTRPFAAYLARGSATRPGGAASTLGGGRRPLPSPPRREESPGTGRRAGWWLAIRREAVQSRRR